MPPDLRIQIEYVTTSFGVVHLLIGGELLYCTKAPAPDDREKLTKEELEEQWEYRCQTCFSPKR